LFGGVVDTGDKF
jgi:hypothetical protein